MRPARVSDSLRNAIEADIVQTRTERRAPRAGDRLRGQSFADGILQIVFRTGLTLGAAAVLACAIVGLRLAPLDAERGSGATVAERAEVARLPAGSFLEVASSRELIDAGEEEILYPHASEPAVRVRLRSIERHAWADTERGAFIAIEVPREDVLLIPVSMQ
ncbi:MAG TPA: hypothetical protein VFV83_03915 [Chthoniobacteraceae bacterium]|nr:hypothetical protein [Chthoniobacteraceae bacterium]